jgi:UDP-N-acetylmuramate-alanine ligase
LDPHIIKKYTFIVEACEYKRHFLHLDPDRTAITSLELDHTDYYRDMDDYQEAFVQLIKKTKQQVFLAPNMDIDRIPKKHQNKCRITKQEQVIFNYVFGEHYQINSSLLIPVLDMMGCPSIDHNVRENFHGLWRRMEYLGTTKQ